jgi:uncharacterized membrane protein
MSVLHLHLLMNHVPVIGTVFLALLFAFAFIRNDARLARLGLVFAAMLAVVTGLVYLTGGAAEEVAEKISGVSERTISLHEEAAEISTIAFTIMGVLALGTLLFFRRNPLSRGITGAALAISLVVGGMLAWTANLGGNIRHTELQSGAAASGGASANDHDD